MLNNKQSAGLHWRSLSCKVQPFLARSAYFSILLAAMFFALAAGLQQMAPAQTAAPPEVEVMTVLQKDVPDSSEWDGTTE
jgi:hypothetical protein